MAEYKKTKWHEELEIFSKIKPLIIIEGNINDKYIYPQDDDFLSSGESVNINQYLYAFYKNLGYKHVIFYNHIKGFFDDCSEEPELLENFAQYSLYAGLHGVFCTGTVPVLWLRGLCG